MKVGEPLVVILPSWVAVNPPLVVPKRREEPEVKVPVRVRVPPVQSIALLSAKASVEPVSRLMVEVLAVTSRVPAVSANVAASRVAAAIETADAFGSTLLAPKIKVPALMVVAPV